MSKIPFHSGTGEIKPPAALSAQPSTPSANASNSLWTEGRGAISCKRSQMPCRGNCPTLKPSDLHKTTQRHTLPQELTQLLDSRSPREVAKILPARHKTLFSNKLKSSEELKPRLRNEFSSISPLANPVEPNSTTPSAPCFTWGSSRMLTYFVLSFAL